MCSGICISTTVTQPYIKASICQQKAKTFILQVNYPICTRAKESMLKKSYWLCSISIHMLLSTMRNSVNPKDVTIFCGYKMFFNWVSIMYNNLRLKYMKIFMWFNLEREHKQGICKIKVKRQTFSIILTYNFGCSSGHSCTRLMVGKMGEERGSF